MRICDCERSHNGIGLGGRPCDCEEEQMAGHLQHLLDQKGPLEDHELEGLRQWFETLKTDTELFGETDEDLHRMDRIQARINKEQGS